MDGRLASSSAQNRPESRFPSPLLDDLSCDCLQGHTGCRGCCTGRACSCQRSRDADPRSFFHRRALGAPRAGAGGALRSIYALLIAIAHSLLQISRGAAFTRGNSSIGGLREMVWALHQNSSGFGFTGLRNQLARAPASVIAASIPLG